MNAERLQGIWDSFQAQNSDNPQLLAEGTKEGLDQGWADLQQRLQNMDKVHGGAHVYGFTQQNEFLSAAQAAAAAQVRGLIMQGL